jgi:hypothetical protein
MNMIKNGVRYTLWKAVTTPARITEVKRKGGVERRRKMSGWFVFWLPEDCTPSFKAVMI